MPADFAGTTVAITGAASGIGRALAVQMCGAGANLVLGDLDVDRLNELRMELDVSQGRIQTIRYDAASRTSSAELVARASERTGSLTT